MLWVIPPPPPRSKAWVHRACAWLGWIPQNSATYCVRKGECKGEVAPGLMQNAYCFYSRESMVVGALPRGPPPITQDLPRLFTEHSQDLLLQQPRGVSGALSPTIVSHVLVCKKTCFHLNPICPRSMGVWVPCPWILLPSRKGLTEGSTSAVPPLLVPPCSSLVCTASAAPLTLSCQLRTRRCGGHQAGCAPC